MSNRNTSYIYGYSVNGYYGSGRTPCTVFVYENRRGRKWYCVEDSCNVNYTSDDIDEGCNVEELRDVDTMTSSKPILTLDQLIEFVDN